MINNIFKRRKLNNMQNQVNLKLFHDWPKKKKDKVFCFLFYFKISTRNKGRLKTEKERRCQGLTCRCR